MENLLTKKLPERFTDAVTKLYTAFHTGKLDAMNCSMCAAGNLCNHNPSWAALRGHLGEYDEDFEKINVYIQLEERVTKKYRFTPDSAKEKFSKNSSYKITEIIQVEKRFLNAMGYDSLEAIAYRSLIDRDKKDQNFKGLCAVIEYLCELDNIPNIMEYQSLFKEENKELLIELT